MAPGVMPPEAPSDSFDPLANKGAKKSPKKPTAVAAQQQPQQQQRPAFQMNAQQKAIFQAVATLNQNEGAFLEAITKAEETLGPKHPDVMTKCSKLADLYFHTARFGDAVPLLKKSLEIVKETDADNVSELAKLQNNLGAALRKSGQQEEALPLHYSAVDSSVACFGRDHPNTDTAKSNLVGLLQEMGRNTEAIKLLQDIADQEEAQPDNTPNKISRVAGALRGLALVQQTEKFFAEAEKNLRRAYDMFMEAYTEMHPATGSTLAALAGVLKQQEKWEEAEKSYEQLLSLTLQALGPNHMQTAIAMHTLAGVKSTLQKHQEAVDLAESAVGAVKAANGPTHMATADFLTQLGKVATDAGDEAKAEAAIKESEEIKELLAANKDLQQMNLEQAQANKTMMDNAMRNAAKAQESGEANNPTQERLRKKLEARKQGNAALTPRSAR